MFSSAREPLLAIGPPVSITAAGYYQSFSNLTLLASQIVTQDVRSLRMRFGQIAGSCGIRPRICRCLKCL